MTQLSMLSASNAVIDASNVYFTTKTTGTSGTNQVVRVAKTGATTQVLATAKFAYGLALDGAALYFADRFEGTIRRVWTTGSSRPRSLRPMSETFQSLSRSTRAASIGRSASGVFAAPK